MTDGEPRGEGRTRGVRQLTDSLIVARRWKEEADAADPRPSH